MRAFGSVGLSLHSLLVDLRRPAKHVSAQYNLSAGWFDHEVRSALGGRDTASADQDVVAISEEDARSALRQIQSAEREALASVEHNCPLVGRKLKQR